MAEYRGMKDPFKEEAARLDKDKSWGESVQRYKANVLKRPDEVMKPKVDRVTWFDKSRAQRQFDPILQSWRDEAKETSLRSAEASTQSLRLNRAKDRQLKTESTFDVVNHEHKLNGIEKQKEGMWQEHWNGETWLSKCIKSTLDASSYKSDTNVPYNILSNQSHADHHWAPPGLRPVVKEVVHPPRQISVVCGRRDFNIVTNRYISDHEDKTVFDRESNKRELVEKYWRKGDYDPIRVQYRDTDKEDEYQRMNREIALNQEKSQLEGMPPVYKESLGTIYNITTLQVKDEERLRAHDKVDKENLERLRQTATNHVERVQKEKMFEQCDLEAKRAYNRIAHQRYKEFDINKGGHHLITNVWYDGRNSKPPPPPVTKAAPTLWQKCEQKLPKSEFDSSQYLHLNPYEDYVNVPYALDPDMKRERRPSTKKSVDESATPCSTRRSVRSSGLREPESARTARSEANGVPDSIQDSPVSAQPPVPRLALPSNSSRARSAGGIPITVHTEGTPMSNPNLVVHTPISPCFPDKPKSALSATSDRSLPVSRRSSVRSGGFKY